MYGVVRRYQGSALSDALSQRAEEVEELLRGVPGFVAYYGLRAADGYVSITICDDQAGTQESNKVAAGWVKENLPAGAVSAPEITEGEAFINFTR
jgi:heme-degrading monooxygenase HmoA